MKKYFVPLILFLVMATTSSAFASEEAASGMMSLVSRAIPVVILIALVVVFAGKKISAFFAGRTNEIDETFRTLAERRQEAELKLRQAENRISDLDRKREEILLEAKNQAEIIKNTIIAEAHKTAERIKMQAGVAAQQELSLAVDSIRNQMAEEIVVSAEKIVRERLKPENQEGLINEYLKKVVVN